MSMFGPDEYLKWFFWVSSQLEEVQGYEFKDGASFFIWLDPNTPGAKPDDKGILDRLIQVGYLVKGPVEEVDVAGGRARHRWLLTEAGAHRLLLKQL